MRHSVFRSGASLISRLIGIWRMPSHERFPRLLRKLANAYLSRRSRGILHIGAHEGAEAKWHRNKKVIWIEANPEHMEGLRRNIAAFPNHRAFCGLIGDAKRDVDFHIASNFGASSSVFAFGPYATGADSLWPDANLHMHRTTRLRMRTLDTFLTENVIDAREYDHWVIDVQGAELLVLKGATCGLACCKVLTLEVSTVEVYNGGPLYGEIRETLASAHFIPLVEPYSLNMRHGDVTFIHESMKQSFYLRVLLFLLARVQSALPEAALGAVNCSSSSGAGSL